MLKKSNLPLRFVVGHTLLLLLTLLAMLASSRSSNPDSTIGFLMAVVTGYFVDFPIGILVEYLYGSGPREVWVQVVLYFGLGNLMWFAVGSAIQHLRSPFSRYIVRPMLAFLKHYW